MTTHAARTAVFAMVASCSAATAQSLFVRSLDEPAPVGSSIELRSASMYLVEPPEPRQFFPHDIVYVIINENSRSSSGQSLETTTESNWRDRLNGVIDPLALLELRLDGSSISNLDLIDMQTKHEFTGDGQYDRDDRLDARVAAEVIDVKPNGNLVLQARKQIVQDGEVKNLVLSGVARQDDVTTANTVLSSQLADLRVDVQHEGELRESAKKGIITRALETLFAF
jgi:flagellar L-ring protein precursor FlgH